MKAPERSTALARVLASQTEGLPERFAAQVAVLAATETTRRWSWNELASLAAPAVMIGLSVAGWLRFGPREPDRAEWLGPAIGIAASQPWLVIGVTGIAIVQLLTFRRRATL